MAEVRVYNNIFEEEYNSFTFNPEKPLVEQIEEHLNKNIYKETLVECYDTETGETFYAPLEENTEHPCVMIGVNGKSVDKDYVPEENDLVKVVFLPMSESAADTFAATFGGAVVGALGAMVVIGIGVLAGVVTGGAGAVLFWGLVGAVIGGIAGYGIHKLKEEASSAAKNLSKNGKEGEALPDVRGAENQSLKNNNYPFIIGKHLVTPFIVGDPVTEYIGSDAYIRMLLCVGYGPLKLTDFKLGEFMLAYNRSHEIGDGSTVTKDTLISGLLKGYSSGGTPDNGDILDYWRNNDIELEILQQTPNAYSKVNVNPYFQSRTAIDLSHRQKVSAATMRAAGWTEVQDGEICTLYSVSYSNAQHNVCVLCTPIYIDGSVLSPTEMQNVANYILNGSTDYSLYLLATFTGENCEQACDEYAQALHNDQEIFYLDENINYGSVYPEACIDQSIDANVFYINDEELNAQAQVVYKGTSFPNNFRTNGVWFTEACPMSFTINIDFPQGLYASYNKTTQGESSNTSEVVYEEIPVWACVQWRFYNKNNATSDELGTDYNSWNNIVFDHDGSQLSLTFSEAFALADKLSHKGNDFGEQSLSDIYANFLGKTLTCFSPLSGEDYISENRISATVNLTKAQCQQLLNSDNTMNAIEVRVLRISPNYLNETSDEGHAEGIGTYSYSDHFKVISIVTTPFDKELLEKNEILSPKRPQSAEDMKKFCYVAVKAKADSSGYILSQFKKLNCVAESFSPYWDSETHKMMPENVSKVTNYYGYFAYDAENQSWTIPTNRSNSAKEKLLLDDEESTAKQKYEAERHLGYNWYKEEAGSNFVRIMKDIIFAESNAFIHNDWIAYKLSTDAAKYNINTVVSGFMLACVGGHCGPVGLGYEDLNINSIGEWAEKTLALKDGSTFSAETTYNGVDYHVGEEIPVRYEANGYVYQGVKFEDLLSKLAICGRAVWTIDETGKIKIIFDGPVDYTKGVINAQNCTSSGNTFSYADIPAGLYFSFSDENDGYETNQFYCWADGNSLENYHGTVEPYSIEFVTNPYQMHSLGRYILACRVQMKEVLTRKIGPEGTLFSLGDVILVQSEDLLIGDCSGRIQEVIESDGRIQGFIMDAVFEYTAELDEDNNAKQGVTVIQPGYLGKSNAVTIPLSGPRTVVIGTRRITMAKGQTNVVLFGKIVDTDYGVPRSNDDPSTTVTDKYNMKTGDICMLGIRDKISAPYRITKIKPESKGGFTQTLVPYDESLYNYGAALPSFQNYITPPAVSDPPITLSEVPTSIRELVSRDNNVLAKVVNIYSNHIITLYKTSNTVLSETGITSDATYNFSNNQFRFSGPGDNGWSTEYPTGTSQQIWVTSATAYGKEKVTTIESDDWAKPVVMGQNGSNGLSVYTIHLYKRVTEQPDNSQIPANLTYYFDDGHIDCSNLKGWSDSVPDVGADGRPCWDIHATVQSTGNTAVVETGPTWRNCGWSTPVKILQDGITEAQVEAMIGTALNETPKVYFTPSSTVFVINEQGVIPKTQSVDVTVRIVQNNEDLDFSFGGLQLPDGLTAVAHGHTLTVTALAGARLEPVYHIDVPIIYSTYEEYDSLVDTEDSPLVWFSCETGNWKGKINSALNLPANPTDKEWFLFTGTTTQVSTDLVKSGYLVKDKYYSYDISEHRWIDALFLELGLQSEGTVSSSYNEYLTISTTPGGTYYGGISATANIPNDPEHLQPALCDYFTWTGNNNTSYQGVTLKKGCIYQWNGNGWELDTESAHKGTALVDILSAAGDDLRANDSTVTEMVQTLMAWNIVTQSIKVTGEAFIDSAIVANLTLGTNDSHSNCIKSYNFTQNAGFSINADGSAIFRNLKVGTGNGYSLLENGKINTELIDAGSIDVQQLNIKEDGYIKSWNYSAVSPYAGFKLDGETGTIYCNSAFIRNSTIFDGTIKGTALKIGQVSGETYHFNVDSNGNMQVGYNGNDWNFNLARDGTVRIGPYGSVGSRSYKTVIASNGALTAIDGNFTGTVTATSGTFTGTVNAQGGTFTGVETISGTLDCRGFFKLSGLQIIDNGYRTLYSQRHEYSFSNKDELLYFYQCFALYEFSRFAPVLTTSRFPIKGKYNIQYTYLGATQTASGDLGWLVVPVVNGSIDTEGFSIYTCCAPGATTKLVIVIDASEDICDVYSYPASISYYDLEGPGFYSYGILGSSQRMTRLGPITSIKVSLAFD